MKRLIALLVGLGINLVLITAANAQVKEITVLGWGGNWRNIFAPLVEQFTQQTGIQVKFATQSNASDGLNKLMAQRANPQVDLWLSVESVAETATKAGLLAPLDPKSIPFMQELPSAYKRATYVATWLSPRGIFYRKDLVPFEITEWAQLWDPRLKEKVGITFSLDRGSFLVVASVINGGSETDIDAGFRKISEIKQNTRAIYNTDADVVRLLESGEIAVAAWAGLPSLLPHIRLNDRYRFVMPKPRFVSQTTGSLVNGRSAEQQAAAVKFLNFILSPAAQSAISAGSGTTPVNPAASVSDDLKKVLPPLPISDIYVIDWSAAEQDFPKWADRWAREVQVRQ